MSKSISSKVAKQFAKELFPSADDKLHLEYQRGVRDSLLGLPVFVSSNDMNCEKVVAFRMSVDSIRDLSSALDAWICRFVRSTAARYTDSSECFHLTDRERLSYLFSLQKFIDSLLPVDPETGDDLPF